MVVLVRRSAGSPIIDTKRPVLDEITGRLPVMLELLLAGMLIARVGIPLGIVSARWKGKPLDVGVRAGSIFGVSMPAFFLGLILQVIFFRALPGCFRWQVVSPLICASSVPSSTSQASFWWTRC